MKKDEIKVGGHYLTKLSGTITTVRVDAIHPAYTGYDVTNLRTGRKTTFRSAAKFRREVKPRNVVANMAGDTPPKQLTPPEQEDENRPDPTTVVANGGVTTAVVQPMTHQPALTVAGTAQPSLGIASRIASIRQTRVPGTPVAGMVPNDEQESILAIALAMYSRTIGPRVVVVGAGAGTGKTATDRMLEQVLPGRGQYTAFNASLVAESKPKFSKAACNTTHSLAFRAVGKQYQRRLGGERVRSGQVARILGVEDMSVKLEGMGPPDEEGKPTDKVKTLRADFLAGQVLTTIKRFCQSADMEIGPEHLQYIDGIDVPTGDGRRGRKNNDLVRDYLLPFCAKAWDDICNVDGQLPFSHDCYVKIWQLGRGDNRPIIPADYILLDEYQDTAAVFLDVLIQQTHALLILVGDDNQRIYEWRGAVNAGDYFPDAPRRLLSQSYRFGQAVADVANAVLATLDEPTDLVMSGMPFIPSRVAPVPEPQCYLYRTNAGAVGRVMAAIAEGKHPHLIGGGADAVAWCQAAVDLQERRGTRHPELCCFDTWQEVVQYSKTDDGSDLKLMVKLVTDFGAARIRDALKDMPSEEYADLVVSTAHKSKGREWDTVRLGQDFPLKNRMGDADRRLLYVAATRAKLTLDITECPPFRGGHERVGEGSEDGWIPGIEVQYTRPMPTQEEQDAWLATKEQQRPSAPTPAPTAPAPEPEVDAKPDSRYRFGKLEDGKWYMVGPPIPDYRRNQVVRVPRRDGSTPKCYIQSVVKKGTVGGSEVWWYDVTAIPAA